MYNSIVINVNSFNHRKHYNLTIKTNYKIIYNAKNHLKIISSKCILYLYKEGIKLM